MVRVSGGRVGGKEKQETKSPALWFSIKAVFKET
jgi:hypothetical protein